MRIERDGASSVAGMLSRYLPASRDGWTHALLQLQDYLRTPTDREPADAFAPEARRLGEVTRALHDALGSHDDDPAFAPEPVSAADVRRWTADTRRAIDESLALLAARAGRLDRSIAPMAKAIAGRGEAAKRRLDEIAGALEGEGEGKEERGRKLRHHGDYHLGQVLRTADGDWMIIDFEGEPARPLAARRARSSPARDVAGMLRSFAYAAATGASEVGGLGPNAAVETRSARWERDARAAFLAGYDMPAESPLIALFEMEKLFYELAYELNNRPEWVWIPLRGIARLF
jgi:maltose alpha-D-glucosyltransferase/alpha-amylase